MDGVVKFNLKDSQDDIHQLSMFADIYPTLSQNTNLYNITLKLLKHRLVQVTYDTAMLRVTQFESID